MAYISDDYKMSKRQIDIILDNVDHITPEILLMVDYAYHHKDADYDGGLSFLDRLYWKLKQYYDVQWLVPNLKETIRASNDPEMTYMDILNEILDEEMVVCYGI